MTEGAGTLSRERLWAMACYLPAVNIVSCLLVSVMMVNSSLCLFHLRQGLVLFAMWASTVVIALVSQTLSLMLLGVVLVLHFWGAVGAYKQNQILLPFVGMFAQKIPPYYLYKRLTGKDPEKPIL